MRSLLLRRARIALLFGLMLPAPAIAQSLIGGIVLNGGVPAYNVNSTAPFTIDQATLGLRVTCVSGCSGGGGGGGATGSVGAAGTNGTTAQSIQGITGGVPVPVSGSFSSSPVAGTNERDITDSRTLDATSTSSQQTYTVNGQSTLSFTASGLTASSATIAFFQSNDWNGTTGTFTAIGEVNTGTGVASLTRSTDGQSAIGIEGTKAVRVQVTTAGTGTITLATNISVRSRYLALRAPLPPGSNALGSVLADLRIAGAANTAANPGFMQLTAGTATIGSIANASFGISGSLPSFASTPTFNVGTTNGLALDATVIARLGTLGQKTASGSAPVVIASDQPAIPVSGTVATTAGATATASGGVTVLSRLPASAAGTNATVAKSSAGRVYKVTGYNSSTKVLRIKFYNTASAPTVGTTTVVWSRVLPPGAFSYDQADLGWGTFSAGIAYALTAGAADGDATAVAAGDITDLHVEGL